MGALQLLESRQRKVEMLLLLQKLSIAYGMLNCSEEEELFFLLAARLSTIVFSPLTGKINRSYIYILFFPDISFMPTTRFCSCGDDCGAQGHLSSQQQHSESSGASLRRCRPRSPGVDQNPRKQQKENNTNNSNRTSYNHFSC